MSSLDAFLTPDSLSSDRAPSQEAEAPIPAGDAGVSRWLRVPRWMTLFATSLFIAGVFVRLTIGDGVIVASTVYYATPWSILAGLAVLNGIAAGQRRLRARRSGWFAAAGLCGIAWFGSSWCFSSGPLPPQRAKIVVWNMAHGERGLPGIVASLAQLDPDIAILVEADPKGVDVRSVFQSEFSDRHVAMLGGGLVLVSRWPSGISVPYHVGDLQTESRIREIDVQTPWGPWTVFAVDLGSSPFYSRKQPLKELARLIDRRGDRPVIVGGDFNTPLDSEHYEVFRNLGLQELFLSAGSGYVPTWPVPIPVLSLDQIWVNERLAPIACEREWDWRSDHAAAVGTVAPVETRPAETAPHVSSR